MKVLFIILILASTTPAKAERSSSLAHSFKILNAVGTKVTRIDVRKNEILAGDGAVLLSLGELTVTDENRSVQPSEESIVGEVYGCTIGSTPLPEGKVQLLFRNRGSLSISEARQPFAATLRLESVTRSGGLLSCAAARISLSQSRQTLAEFNVAVQLMPRPEWHDASGRVVQGISLDFSGPRTALSQPMDVESKVVTVHLMYAQSDCSCLHFVGPQECAIGTNLIMDRDIRLNVNGRNVAPGNCLSINSARPIAVKLVFDKSGFYNRYQGVVGCKQPGQFVYSY